MKPIAGLIRERWLTPIIQDSERVYKAGITDIQQYQLARFNRLWADIRDNVPYYQKLVHDNIVPPEIHDWDDFVRIPVLTRALIQQGVTPFINRTQKVDRWALTGGSTGTPIRIPGLAGESMPSVWVGRSFYNIQVADRMFHIWGHSHLFGTGWKKYIKQARRDLRSWLYGYQDFSAYHLTPQRLSEAAEAILKMRPDFVLAYSRVLTLLAKQNTDKAADFRRLPLKAIIATSEPFSGPEDVERVEQVFGCPVALEYGASEVGVMAYTHPSDRRYRAFWDTYLLEAVPINETDAQLRVTSLHPRAMPLIRYDVGDTVRNFDCDQNSITGFDAVLGRDNDLIQIGDGAFVHPLAVIHSVQARPGVLGVQVVQEKDNSLSISMVCKSPLSAEDEAIIRHNLASLDEQLNQCKISYVEHLEQTVAGKTKWVIKR